VTLHQARAAALKIFAARTEGRDPAAEKQHARRRLVADRVEDLVKLFISEHVSQTRSAGEISRLLHREVIANWGKRSVHEIGKREVIELVREIVARGAPAAANKLLKVIKTFFGWCVGRAILEVSPANGLSAPTREKPRDRVLSDAELTSVLAAARQIDGPYGAIVEFLALTGQRREEVAQLTWAELDLASRVWTIPACRAKNAKSHIVHLSSQSVAVLMRMPKVGSFVFSVSGVKPFIASARRNGIWTEGRGSRVGGSMIFAGLASRGWPGSGSLRMSLTRYSTIRVGPFQGSLPCTSVTSSWRSANTPLIFGVGMSSAYCCRSQSVRWRNDHGKAAEKPVSPTAPSMRRTALSPRSLKIWA
jgi:site-specific recombinase XerD